MNLLWFKRVEFKILVCTFGIFLTQFASAQTFKFYQTQNVHNQLRLNVKSGEVYQIQDDGQKFLVHEGDTESVKIDERYELHKTKNMWTYILLDKCNGKLWQCQYSVDGINNIFSIPINEKPLSETLTKKFSIQPLVSMYQYYLIDEEMGSM